MHTPQEILYDEILSIKNQLQLTIFEPLKNMGYMNAKYNVMFWINFLINIELNLQYNHIDHIHEVLMTNDVGSGDKLGFTKNP